jgi:hypothetical protein
MWGIDPSLLCQKHLCGEHVEMHMFRGTILKGISTKGYLENNLVMLGKIKERHDLLSKEMIKRKMNHKTPMGKFDEGTGGIIDVEANIKDLRKRCKECDKLYLTSKRS